MSLFVGVILGAFSHLTSSLPGAWRWVGNFGALWVAVAFFLGRFTREMRKGLIAGAVALSAAGIVHYVPFRWAREGLSWHAFRWPVVLWLAVGIVIGAAFGALGAAHGQRRARMSVLAAAGLVAIFAGEAYVLWRTGHRRAVQVAVPIELLVAMVLPLALFGSWKERVATYIAAAALLPLAILGFSAFMGVIHRVYPGV